MNVKEEKEVFDQWAEHFEELLNAVKGNKDPEKVRRNARPVVDDGQCESPTYEEESNIQKLKNKRAPGEDDITVKLIKYGGKAVTETVHKLH